MGRLASRGRRGQRGLRGLKVLQGRRETWGQSGRRDQLDCQDPLESMALRDRPELEV